MAQGAVVKSQTQSRLLAAENAAKVKNYPVALSAYPPPQPFSCLRERYSLYRWGDGMLPLHAEILEI